MTPRPQASPPPRSGVARHESPYQRNPREVAGGRHPQITSFRRSAMAMEFPQPNQVAAKIARTKRHAPDTDLTDLRRELHAAHIAKVVREMAAKFPPLSDDQKSTLALLIKGGGR